MKAAPYLAIPLAVVLLLFGVYMGGHPQRLPDFMRDSFLVQGDDAGVHAEILEKINDDYYKKVDDKKLEESSQKGLVKALHDRFSHYLTPKETKQFQESINGSFSGVGMSVAQDKRGLRVQMVFPKSPAQREHIHKGDVITAVNGRSIAGVASDVATARIKGPAGTNVRLTIQTPPSKHDRVLNVKRQRIDVPVARGRIVTVGGVKLGVVQLASFTDGAHAAVSQQVQKLRRKGAKGIVFDLRGNGGGLLREAVLVSSIFVDKGLIVSTKGRARAERKFQAVGGAIPANIPVVVLVDRGSASASEITTGALKDRRRATVVGTRTFGKGVFQEVEPLTNGGVLDLTVGRYYLPSGQNISGKGIQPQVRARDNPRTKRDEALPKALETLRKKAG
jgi:carboxyl-terminal processing protease